LIPTLCLGQDLELKKGNRISTFKIGEEVLLKLNEGDSLISIKGKIDKIIRDSIYLMVTSIKKRNNNKTFEMSEKYSKAVPYFVLKENVTKIIRRSVFEVGGKIALVGMVSGVTSIVTIVNSQLITQVDSKKRLLNIGLIEGGVSLALICTSISLRGKKIGHDHWRIL